MLKKQKKYLKKRRKLLLFFSCLTNPAYWKYKKIYIKKGVKNYDYKQNPE